MTNDFEAFDEIDCIFFEKAVQTTDVEVQERVHLDYDTVVFSMAIKEITFQIKACFKRGEWRCETRADYNFEGPISFEDVSLQYWAKVHETEMMTCKGTVRDVDVKKIFMKFRLLSQQMPLKQMLAIRGMIGKIFCKQFEVENRYANISHRLYQYDNISIDNELKINNTPNMVEISNNEVKVLLAGHTIRKNGTEEKLPELYDNYFKCGEGSTRSNLTISINPLFFNSMLQKAVSRTFEYK